MSTATVPKYNVVYNEGEPTSAVLFLDGKRYVASKDQPHFDRIVNGLEGGAEIGDIVDLFNMAVGISKRFERLSERVTINSGRIFLDGDEVNNALSQAIVRFYSEGNDDFKPLVSFMEKIETNPNEHSRENLFRWLSQHKFGLCPDGDFIAYKGLRHDRTSVTSGRAFVNGEVVQGNIPNEPDTIVEMPRSDVQHNPSNGCSTGLHVGNWAYASSFGDNLTVRAKINPRDVVSVPTDCDDQKMRVCRYRVLDTVHAEDRTMLFVTPDRTRKLVAVPEPDPVAVSTKPARKQRAKAKKAPAVVKLPRYYELYKREHYEAENVTLLRWLVKEWEVKLTEAPIGTRHTKAQLIDALIKKARARRRTWTS